VSYFEMHAAMSSLVAACFVRGAAAVHSVAGVVMAVPALAPVRPGTQNSPTKVALKMRVVPEPLLRRTL